MGLLQKFESRLEQLVSGPMMRHLVFHLAAVDDLQFLHSIKVGDMIILKSRVTCVFNTSLEVQVDVFSEETLTGKRQLTSTAFLTFVAIDRNGGRVGVPPLVVETEDEKRICAEAHERRAARLRKKAGAAGRTQ